MSLQTDRIFFEALKSDATVMRLTGGRIYNTAIPLPDEDADNVPAPYIIITFDGLTNQNDSKDYVYEGDFDQVRISLEMVAVTRDALATLAERVRSVVRSFFENYADDGDLYDLVPVEYDYTASDVSYDADKPCFVQRMTYQCLTNI